MAADKSRDNSEFSTNRLYHWEQLMRKFSQAHKEHCNYRYRSTTFHSALVLSSLPIHAVISSVFVGVVFQFGGTPSLDFPQIQRSVKKFPTGSQYEGTWDLLGMSGYGVYKFPNGVVYHGQFDDGMFHGDGDMVYPSSVTIRGKWKKGQLTERILIFADGLQYAESNWAYCKIPDRRFTIENDTGIQPSGRSYLTAEQPMRPVPPGYYDTGDGFYDPKSKVVYKHDDLSSIIRSPSVREQKWIVDNCRTSPELPLGPRRDLYEEWSKPELTLPLPTVMDDSRKSSMDEACGAFLEPDQDMAPSTTEFNFFKRNWRQVSRMYFGSNK